MVDETFTALQYAGPASWHHLIAPTRTIPLTTHSIHAISFAHWSCNSSKNSKTLEEYRAWQARLQQAS